MKGDYGQMAGKMMGGMKMMSDKVWGPQPPKSPNPTHSPGTAAGDSSLSGAVGELHKEHPHHVQGEGLQHMSTTNRHSSVSSGTYKGGYGRG